MIQLPRVWCEVTTNCYLSNVVQSQSRGVHVNETIAILSYEETYLVSELSIVQQGGLVSLLEGFSADVGLCMQACKQLGYL